MYCATFIDKTFTNEAYGPRMGVLLRHVAWTLYWIIQGQIFTGLWVIGHECGHGGFSESSIISDITGIVIHTCLLVPYFSWKISHRRHHSNTGNVGKDEVFVPLLAPTGDHQIYDQFSDDNVLVHTFNSIKRLLSIATMLTFGWPLYLLINSTGHQTYPKGSWVNHFLPNSPIFTTTRERILVFCSDLFLGVWIYALVQIANVIGSMNVLYYYVGAYIVNNAFLVLITFLQHTDYALPHYAENEWDWLRGALATVDRDFGILNYFHHHISDTHIAHHLFSSLPHYHAQEATEAIKPILKNYYRMDRRPIFDSLWEIFGECIYVTPDIKNPGILWFEKPMSKKNN